MESWQGRLLMNGYRLVTVASVHVLEESLLVEFADCRVGIDVRRRELEKVGIETLSPGDQIWIKGKNGNSDADLWGVGSIEDMKEFR